MTTATLSVEDAVGQLRPHLTDDALRAIRDLGRVVGFRNLARALSVIAPKGKAAHVLTDDELDRLQELEEQMLAAECFFAEYPAFAGAIPLRTVIRTRKRTGILARGSWHGQVEQIAVTREMAEHVKHHYGVEVEPAKKATKARRNGKGGVTAGRNESDTWWADCEDQAWGQDVYLEEWFGARASEHTSDDLLPMFRKALELKASIPRLQAAMQRIEAA